jgi:hypothetical protein
MAKLDFIDLRLQSRIHMIESMFRHSFQRSEVRNGGADG